MRLLTPFILLTIFISCNRADRSDRQDTRQEPLTDYPYKYIDTESRFSDSTGLQIIIQNSLPKGPAHVNPNGKQFDTKSGKQFDSRIFWTRVINQTDSALELRINFPDYSSAILSSINSNASVFLPSDTMTIDKETEYGYGITGWPTGPGKPTMFEKTIKPKEACLFYTVVLFTGSYAPPRAGLVLKEQKLFYRIRGIAPELDSTLIPCGQVIFNN
jgi:hypothetical protein